MIAERVGCPVYQLEHEMPPEELYEWAHLLAEEAEEQKKQREASAAKAKGRRR